jgi:hypothetical protein
MIGPGLLALLLAQQAQGLKPQAYFQVDPCLRREAAERPPRHCSASVAPRRAAWRTVGTVGPFQVHEIEYREDADGGSLEIRSVVYGRSFRGLRELHLQGNDFGEFLPVEICGPRRARSW